MWEYYTNLNIKKSASDITLKEALKKKKKKKKEKKEILMWFYDKSCCIL